MISRSISHSAATLALVVLTGCPSNDKNPAVLWLAPLDGETMVQLVDGNPGGY